MRRVEVLIKCFFGAGAGAVTFFLLLYKFFCLSAGMSLILALSVGITAFIIGINSRKK